MECHRKETEANETCCQCFGTDIRIQVIVFWYECRKGVQICLVGGENMEGENMATVLEFRAVLMAILDFLKHDETGRAIAYIEEVLSK